jgi:hypothetical protein
VNDPTLDLSGAAAREHERTQGRDAPGTPHAPRWRYGRRPHQTVILTDLLAEDQSMQR